VGADLEAKDDFLAAMAVLWSGASRRRARLSDPPHCLPRRRGRRSSIGQLPVSGAAHRHRFILTRDDGADEPPDSAANEGCGRGLSVGAPDAWFRQSQRRISFRPGLDLEIDVCRDPPRQAAFLGGAKARQRIEAGKASATPSAGLLAPRPTSAEQRQDRRSHALP